MAGVVGGGHAIQVGLDAPLQVARWRPFFAWVPAIPHLIGALAVPLTGAWPQGTRDFVGAARWGGRVNGYASLLTDRYPPFSTD